MSVFFHNMLLLLACGVTGNQKQTTRATGNSFEVKGLIFYSNPFNIFAPLISLSANSPYKGEFVVLCTLFLLASIAHKGACSKQFWNIFQRHAVNRWLNIPLTGVFNTFKSWMEHKTSANWSNSWKLVLIRMVRKINGSEEHMPPPANQNKE